MVVMRKTGITLVTAAAAALLLAGCSGGSETGGAPAPAPENKLAGFDPCTVLSDSELQAFGASGPGEPVDQGVGEPGCDFDAGDYILTVYKAEGNGLDYWEGQRSKFGIFEPNKVGSSNGIKAVTSGSQGQGICRQIIEAGGGTVSVSVGYSADKIPSDDATCTKAMEIAQVVEPKLPK
ncbi:Protein of unknown function [Saccharopolyspora flava]|uniref:DUF3558 domain-containing protein n=2 Tax=Saccharopolyspora flava TaxID=95161 RepID=A0A1I6PU55_9PSEU|nr:Protein of unknown function [Saccharopolyspora flava]